MTQRWEPQVCRALGEAPGAGSPRRDLRDRVGHGVGDGAQAGREEAGDHLVPDVDRDVGAGQAGHTDVLTVGVRRDAVPAAGQPLEEEDGRGHDAEAPGQGHHTDLHHHRACQDGQVLRRVTDGDVAIKGHHRQDGQLCHKNKIDGEHLCQAAIEGDTGGERPEDTEGFGYSGRGQQQVARCMHRNMYMGWWRPCSFTMVTSRTVFPGGQWCTSSRPGWRSRCETSPSRVSPDETCRVGP